jgi:hypothetical protein
MSQQQQDAIKARLMAACDTKVINADAVVLGYRQRLERASAVHLPHA